MKPIYEQEWHEEVSNGATFIIGDDDRMICTTREVDAIALGKAISAAPDMARALLMVLYRQGDADSRERAARDVLRKAGVLP